MLNISVYMQIYDHKGDTALYSSLVDIHGNVNVLKCDINCQECYRIQIYFKIEKIAI